MSSFHGCHTSEFSFYVLIIYVLIIRDLGNAMAVSSLWNSLGGRPYMWAKYRGLGKVRKPIIHYPKHLPRSQ